MLSHFRVILLLNYLFRAFAYFRKLQKNSKEFSESLVQLLVHMIVVQFSMSFFRLHEVNVGRRISDSLYIISLPSPFVNTFFKSFLSFFKVFSNGKLRGKIAYPAKHSQFPSSSQTSFPPSSLIARKVGRSMRSPISLLGEWKERYICPSVSVKIIP